MSTNKRTLRLEQMLELSCSLSTSSDLQSFLQSVIRLTCELTESDEAAIMVYDKNVDRLRFIATASSIPELTEVTVPVENSVAGWAFSNDQTLIVSDAAAESRHFKSIDQATGFVTQSLLAVPIIFRGQTLGVIEAVNKANSTHYTGDDVTILETLASQVAIALNTDTLPLFQPTADAQSNLLDQMKNNFISIASHEFRTPLGLILGYATFLREQINPEHHSYLDKIVEYTMKLKGIVENLSSVNNYQSGKAVLRQQTISVTQIVDEVVLSFQNEASAKRQNLSAVTDGDLMISGDAEKITIALSSLVRNAITFTDEGGYIIVRAEQVLDHIQIRVEDTGIGIPVEDQTRIFERFYQVESHLTRQHGGMGLGLSVAKMMIELHGGRIWAESTIAEGSTFTILLPSDAA